MAPHSVYFCGIGHCSKSFTSRRRLNQHYQSHYKQYRCPYPGCYKAFTRKNDLKIHQESHQHRKSEICGFCMMKFADWRYLRKHIKEQHKEISAEKQYVCRKCHKRFDRKDSLQNHWKSHLDKKHRTLLKCSECKQAFTFKPNLRKHIVNVHGPLCLNF